MSNHVAERDVCQKMKLVVPMESWIFTLPQFLFLLMVLYYIIFNVTTPIWM
jgi:hypothetical protein